MKRALFSALIAGALILYFAAGGEIGLAFPLAGAAAGAPEAADFLDSGGCPVPKGLSVKPGLPYEAIYCRSI